jgi:hypothetical protein
MAQHQKVGWPQNKNGMSADFLFYHVYESG